MGNACSVYFMFFRECAVSCVFSILLACGFYVYVYVEYTMFLAVVSRVDD